MWKEVSIYSLPKINQVVLLCDKTTMMINGFGYYKVIGRRKEGFTWEILGKSQEFPLTYFTHWVELEGDPE